MKRIFSVLLVTIMFLSITASALGNDEFEVAKTLLNELGITENLDYNAEGITRAEMIQIMYRMTNGAPIVHGRIDSDNFEDVNEEHWAYEYIETFRYSEVIFGNGDGYFRPDDFITYAEMITIIVRTLGWRLIVLSRHGSFPYGYLNVADERLVTNFKEEYDIHKKVSIEIAIPIIYQALHAPTLGLIWWGTRDVYGPSPSFYERRNLE